MNELKSLRLLVVMAIAVICCGFMLLASGCVKSILGDGTITIKGRLVQDCSGTPIAGMPLEFSVYIGSSKTGGRTEKIGSDTTDQDGNFTVTGKNFGDVHLSVDHDPGGPQSYQYAHSEIKGVNGSTYELGVVYFKHDYAVSVRFIRPASSATDTLYFGDYNNQPVGSAVGSGIDGYVYHVSGQMPGPDLPYGKETRWVWGIGMADYMKAVDSMYSIGQSQNQAPYHRIFTVRMGVCRDDTSTVNLSR